MVRVFNTKAAHTEYKPQHREGSAAAEICLKQQTHARNIKSVPDIEWAWRWNRDARTISQQKFE